MCDPSLSSLGGSRSWPVALFTFMFFRCFLITVVIVFHQCELVSLSYVSGLYFYGYHDQIYMIRKYHLDR